MKVFYENGCAKTYEVIKPLVVTHCRKGYEKKIAYQIRLEGNLAIGYLDKNEDLIGYEPIGSFVSQAAS